MADSEPNEACVLRRDMSMSHADFHRIFPRVAGNAPWRRSGNVVSLSEIEGGTLRITLEPEGVRRIANLQLPRTILELRFEGYAPGDVDAFLERFDRSFRRGGG